MTTLRQAAEMALEALGKTMGVWGGTCAWHNDVEKAIDALKEALARPEQGPAGVVVAAVEAISDAAMIKWTSDYRPKVGDLIYTTPAPIPEGWQLVPIEPTEEMIDCGAQGMASFQEDSVWPDSWDATQVKGMRHDATKAYRYILAAAPKYEEQAK